MQKYLRFIIGLRKYFHDRQNSADALVTAQELLKKRINNRSENFLTILKTGIFGYSKSPYLKFLNSKKITYNDVASKVNNLGVEGALNFLFEEGVYFTVDEFKGKTEVNRNGLKFLCNESSFDNPFLSYVYEVRSGATRSAGTRIRIDFDYLVQRSLYDAFLLSAHDALCSPIANWFPLFPGAPGINSSLRFARIGNPPRKWFSQVDKAQVKVNWEKVWGTNLIFFMAKLQGLDLAKPEYVSLNNAYTVALWASLMLEHFPNCVIYTFAASAVRVCMAAQENNLNIKGVRFFVTGETLTIQKRKEIEDAGAIAVPVYGISEAGVIAAGCNRASKFTESDHCHIYKDTTAIITHKYMVPHFDKVVDSFLFTTLLYESPKLLLNVGMGDYGTIYQSDCNCEFGKIGFDAHIGNIRSYEKLTGEGVTFVDTDFIRIIEKELPSRFGGCSADYQLIEQEDEKGLNRLRLLVSPKLGPVDESKIVKVFINLLKNAESSPESWAQSGTVMWDQARMIRVRRDYPLQTKSGKIMPFFLVK
jgi:hypothetical protein